jgi:hypothetical protein
MTPLPLRMIKDMTLRNFTPPAIRSYFRLVFNVCHIGQQSAVLLFGSRMLSPTAGTCSRTSIGT